LQLLVIRKNKDDNTLLYNFQELGVSPRWNSRRERSRMLLTSPFSLSLSLSCNLPRYVASRINQPAPAVHKLAVWVEASLSSLHFAKLTCTKSLPHYWRTRVRRPRCPRILGIRHFFSPFRPPSPLSLYSPRVGGCERDDKAQRTCVTLSYPVSPFRPRSLLFSLPSPLCMYPRPGTCTLFRAISCVLTHDVYYVVPRSGIRREISSARHCRSRHGRFLLALISRSPSYLET